MSTKRELPKSLQTPSNPGPSVDVPDDTGGDVVGIGYARPLPPDEPSGATGRESPQPRQDPAAEAVAVPRQPETPLPELPPGAERLSSGIVRELAGGVQISSRPDASVPYVFPKVPSKVEQIRPNITRSTF